MDKLTCVTCGKQSDEDKPRGWLVKPKVNSPDELFVICDRCLSMGSATLDVMDSAPFRKLEREVRRENYGNNQRVRHA